MKLDDIRIDIKKQDAYGRWIVNLVICDCFEIRGFIWSQSKYSGHYLQAPKVPPRHGKPFWVAYCYDRKLWDQLQIKVGKIIDNSQLSDDQLEEISKAIDQQDENDED